MVSRVMDVILVDTYESFMLKLAYTLVTHNRKHILSSNSIEDVLQFMTTTLPSEIRPPLSSQE